MAEERREGLPPVHSAKDVEITVWNRVGQRVAKLAKEGATVTNEDYSEMWREEVRKIVTQIEHQDEVKRQQLRKWMWLTQ